MMVFFIYFCSVVFVIVFSVVVVIAFGTACAVVVYVRIQRSRREYRPQRQPANPTAPPQSAIEMEPPLPAPIRPGQDEEEQEEEAEVEDEEQQNDEQSQGTPTTVASIHAQDEEEDDDETDDEQDPNISGVEPQTPSAASEFSTPGSTKPLVVKSPALAERTRTAHGVVKRRLYKE